MFNIHFLILSFETVSYYGGIWFNVGISSYYFGSAHSCIVNLLICRLICCILVPNLSSYILVKFIAASSMGYGCRLKSFLTKVVCCRKCRADVCSMLFIYCPVRGAIVPICCTVLSTHFLHLTIFLLLHCNCQPGSFDSQAKLLYKHQTKLSLQIANIRCSNSTE